MCDNNEQDQSNGNSQLIESDTARYVRMQPSLDDLCVDSAIDFCYWKLFIIFASDSFERLTVRRSNVAPDKWDRLHTISGRKSVFVLLKTKQFHRLIPNKLQLLRLTVWLKLKGLLCYTCHV